MDETLVPDIKNIKEHLKKYVILTEEGDRVAAFVHPYNDKRFNDPGAMNFDMFANYGNDKRLLREDVNYLSLLPRVPKKLKTGDKMNSK
ncbi:MAG: hypothetical protein NT016_02985 [Candidatus Aenigmarchaeota archaeon]|nr:hypothetical protein [Candidatus Aenigmarchaeota archaeon]